MHILQKIIARALEGRAALRAYCADTAQPDCAPAWEGHAIALFGLFMVAASVTMRAFQ